jgi:DNA-binding GntR family transcriptional regulator
MAKKLVCQIQSSKMEFVDSRLAQGVASFMLGDLIPPHNLERTNLSEQATDLLRRYIISGHIPLGRKIVEREVADLLGISRAPARDALMNLEKEGLIISRPGARYVIEPNERDIRELHQVRLLLEGLAVELAARKTSEQNRKALRASLQIMERAIQERDNTVFTRSDVEFHNLIWQQADNTHLTRALKSMLGPIFMVIANNAERFDWDEVLELHRDLVNFINAGDVENAQKSMERHIESSLVRSLQFIQGGGA